MSSRNYAVIIARGIYTQAKAIRYSITA